MRLDLKTVRRAVIVAPHPDDEIIGTAGLIRALRGKGRDVRVIVVSDGAASHPNSRQWPSARLIAARRRESLQALGRLGVRPDRVTFLGLPDGGLPGRQDLCRRQLRRTLRTYGVVDLLVGPAASDAHPDHQAVARALRSGRGRARHLTYQVWPPQRRAGPRCHKVVMPGGVAAKRSLIRLHRTQLGAIRDDPEGFTIARHELDVFAHPVERFAEARR
ncbi:PIG-L deacetylase family protein [Sphingomonas fuzhouensis]|uniref:PIG-L deacetylase family protein n=1 Tax=Sphingomonas fuzhouensis TaxID=3106033 RepID=UPI002AFFB232|nr:PIG-L family deacetylase [Sphingomonas sp. SGZ-02]